MTLQFAIEVLVFGGIVPAAIAIAVVFLVDNLLAENVGQRWAMAAGMAIAFIAGYVILPEWASLTPERHWQWLPYLAGAAMVIGPVGLARGVWTPERLLLWLILGLAAAWFLVPTWESLDPPQSFYIPAAAAYFVVVAALLDRLSNRVSPRMVLAQCFIAASVLAVLVVVGAKSMVYGQMAGLASAATAGCFIATFYRTNAIMVRGMIPAYTVLVGGMAFIGMVEPEEPLVGMLLLPAAPVALWISKLGPLGNLKGIAAIVAATLLVLGVLGIGAALIVTAA